MSEQKKEKVTQGVVVSDKMDKTVIIEVKTRVTHPRIKKVIRRTTRLKVHDENSEAKVGDTIAVVETRPLSKEKRHKLHSIVEKAK